MITCAPLNYSAYAKITPSPPFGVISGVFWNSALDGNTHVDTSSRTSDKTGSSRAEAISNVAPIAAVSVPDPPIPRMYVRSVPQIGFPDSAA